MKPAYLLILIFFFAGCSSTPDGIIVDGNTARVPGAAKYEHNTAALTVDELNGRWIHDSPDLDVQKWLHDNDYNFRYFEPDTSLKLGMTDSHYPIYAGILVYSK